MSVLGSYLGSMPPLPALVLTHLPSGDEVYQYPPNTPIVAPSVILWLQKIEEGTESPAGRRRVVLHVQLSFPSPFSSFLSAPAVEMLQTLHLDVFFQSILAFCLHVNTFFSHGK